MRVRLDVRSPHAISHPAPGSTPDRSRTGAAAAAARGRGRRRSGRADRRRRARAARRRRPAAAAGPTRSRSAPARLGRARRPSCPSTCRTGADANQREDCRIVGVVNSVQDYWGDRVRRLPRGADAVLQRPDVDRLRRRDVGRRAVLLPGATRPSTSTSAFYDELRTRFGAQRRRRSPRPTSSPTSTATTSSTCSAPTTGSAATARARRSGSVRLELQADCYAGVWAAHAVDTGFIEDLTAGRHRRRPRRRGRGRRRPHPAARRPAASTPSRWTHGSSAHAPEVVPHRLPQRRPATAATRSRPARCSDQRPREEGSGGRSAGITPRRHEDRQRRDDRPVLSTPR